MGPAIFQGHGATPEPDRWLTWAGGPKAKMTDVRPTRWPLGGRMSFREITMQDISEVLRRSQAGQSARRIARETGLDRKTVGRYLAEAKDSGLSADTVMSEEVARSVGMAVQSRPLPSPSQPWLTL